MTLKRILLAAVALILLAGVALVLLFAALTVHSRVPSGPAPNIDALKNVLERSATTALTLPQIAEEKVTVAVPKEAVAEEADKVVRLATESGGTGIKTINDGVAGVLASVPAANAPKFYQAVTGKSLSSGGDRHDGKEDFDVVITAAVGSSATP